MIIDKQLLLSDGQDLSQVAGTYLSTNTIDLTTAGTVPAAFQAVGNFPADLGRSMRHLELVVQVDETFTSGGAATLQVQVITDGDAALGSPTVIQSSDTIALATLVAGYRFRVAVPPGLAERYLGVQYVIGTATTTAGTCSAFLLMDGQTTVV